MYGSERCTIWKTEQGRIDAFALRCWRRLLRLPWTAGRSNHSILKEINPAYSSEVLVLKLKLQYFSLLMWGANSLEKILMLGKTEGKRRRGWKRMRWLDSITDSMDMSFSKFCQTVKDREAQSAPFHGVAKSQTWLSNWTTSDSINSLCYFMFWYYICEIHVYLTLPTHLGSDKPHVKCPVVTCGSRLQTNHGTFVSKVMSLLFNAA